LPGQLATIAVANLNINVGIGGELAEQVGDKFLAATRINGQ
jgi:hypothetical protein